MVDVTRCMKQNFSPDCTSEKALKALLWAERSSSKYCSQGF